MRVKNGLVSLLLLLSAFSSAVVFQALPAHASASFSQSANGTTSCTLASPVGSGDLLVLSASAQLTSGAVFSTITASDSLGNSFRFVGGTSGGYQPSQPFIELLYANSTSGASDTITVAWTVTGAGTTVYNLLTCSDFTGMLGSKLTALDSGSTPSQANTNPIFMSTINNINYPAGDILIEAPVLMPCNSGTVSLTPGFSAFGIQNLVDGQCSSTPNAGFFLQFDPAYFVGWPGGHQSFPVSSTVSQAPTTGTGASRELGFGFQPLYTATQPVQATAIDGATTQTVNLTNCSPSPSSFSGDGSVHNISTTPNCVMTLTLPSGYVWLDTFTATTTVTTCSGATTCSTFSDKYLPGTITQPLQATATGGASTQTVTLTGCSPSPGTFSGDGSVHNIVAAPNCSLVLGLPLGFAWTDTGNQFKTFVTCTTGTCSTGSDTYTGASVTQPLIATATGGASVQTVTASNCAVSPTTFSGDGASHSVTAAASCTLTLTLPVGFVWVATSVRTQTFNTCASGTCSTFSATYQAAPVVACATTFSDNSLKIAYYYPPYIGSYLKFASSLAGGCLQGSTFTGQWANFTKFSLASSSNPSQSFAVGVQGGNETVNVIATNYVELVATFASAPLLHFQYVMPSGATTTYPPQIVVRGSSSTTIPFASYVTTSAAFGACSAPCVFINVANRTVSVKVPTPSTEAIDIFFFSSGTLSYTVQTGPVNLASGLTVDGVVYNSPQVFFWTVGSNHTIAANSPVNMIVSPYTSFAFVSWSDGGGQSHTIQAPSSSTIYIATYKTSASTVSCGSPNPLQQLEKGCVVPALLGAWSAPIGLQPWLGFVLLAVNVAIYNKTQSVFLSLTILWVTGAVFSLFLPPYVGLIAQVFLYLGAAGIVVRGILLVR